MPLHSLQSISVWYALACICVTFYHQLHYYHNKCFRRRLNLFTCTGDNEKHRAHLFLMLFVHLLNPDFHDAKMSYIFRTIQVNQIQIYFALEQLLFYCTSFQLNIETKGEYEHLMLLRKVS